LQLVHAVKSFYKFPGKGLVKFINAAALGEFIIAPVLRAGFGDYDDFAFPEARRIVAPRYPQSISIRSMDDLLAAQTREVVDTRRDRPDAGWALCSSTAMT
jgi:hypothetical protein